MAGVLFLASPRVDPESLPPTNQTAAPASLGDCGLSAIAAADEFPGI